MRHAVTTNFKDVYPTLDCSVAKKLNKQLETGGLSLRSRRSARSFNFELYSGECREVCGGICAKRAHDWIVYW